MTRARVVRALRTPVATVIGALLLLSGLGVVAVTAADSSMAEATEVRKIQAPTVLSWVDEANRGCGSERTQTWERGVWRCVFSDDFDGDALNLALWNPGNTSASGFSTGIPPGYVCYVYDPRTVSVGAGTLRLSVVKVRHRFECGGPAMQPTRFIGGAVSTKHRLALTYGRFEVRARFAVAKRDGLQSSIQLRPDQRSYGLSSGEIDIADYFSALPKRVFPAVRYSTKGSDPTARNTKCVLPQPDSFHTYTARWTPDRIELQVDGTTCVSTAWTMGRSLTRPAPFDKPFFLSIFEGLGSSDVMYDPKKPPKFPVSMEVDYVHVWGNVDADD